jgi:hypothetical protein
VKLPIAPCIYIGLAKNRRKNFEHEKTTYFEEKRGLTRDFFNECGKWCVYMTFDENEKNTKFYAIKIAKTHIGIFYHLPCSKKSKRL